MSPEQTQDILKMLKEHGDSMTAPAAISYRTGIGKNRVRAVIDAHRKAQTQGLVSYRIMKKKRQGLRLVRMKMGNDTMDWYTDKDEAGIEAYADQLRRRMIGETA